MKPELQKNRWAAYWGAACRTYHLRTGRTVAEFFVGGASSDSRPQIPFRGNCRGRTCTRALVGVSMIVGVMVTGLIFVTGSAAMAWQRADCSGPAPRIVQEHADNDQKPGARQNRTR